MKIYVRVSRRHHRVTALSKRLNQTSAPGAVSARKCGITLRLKTFSSFTSTLEFCYYVKRPRTWKIASDTTDAMIVLKFPTNITDGRSFRGLCNTFRRFVANLARIAKPLNRKLQNYQTKEFGASTAQEEARRENFKTVSSHR